MKLAAVAHTLAVLTCASIVAISPVITHAAAPKHSPRSPIASRLGEVRFIWHGLSVHPVHGRFLPGRLRMSLFARDGLRTAHAQRASVGFRDGSVLHIDELTDATLRSPTQTVLNSGTLSEIVTPGSNHEVRTVAATADAIGTNFLVTIIGAGSYFMVQRGAVLVRNQFGSVVVKRHQGSLVLPGHAPQPAYPVDSGAAGSWSSVLPAADLPGNLALDADGGRVVNYSSQFAGAAPSAYSTGPGRTAGDAAFINDGRLDQGWVTANRHVSQEWVIVRLPGGRIHHVSDVLIDPASTGGGSAAEDLKTFEILVSTTGTRPEDFHRIFGGACRQDSRVQRFILPAVTARYVELYARSNFGSHAHLAVAEFEVIGR